MKKWRSWRKAGQLRLWRLQDGLRYAFGKGFSYNTTCSACEREIEIEVC